METLRKIILAFVITGMASHTMAQSQAVMQAAFTKSYESEQAGKYSTAISELRAVYNASSYITNIRMGWLCYLAKQYTESVKYYDIAIQLNPYAIEARFGCIKPLSAIESWDRVREQYLHILKIDPQNTVANYWLAVMYYNKKDYATATRLLEKNVNLYPLDYDSIIMLAWSKFYLGKPTDARALFNQALIIRPNDSSALAGIKLLR